MTIVLLQLYNNNIIIFFLKYCVTCSIHPFVGFATARWVITWAAKAHFKTIKNVYLCTRC